MTDPKDVEKVDSVLKQPKAQTLAEIFANIPQHIKDIEVEHLIIVMHRADNNEHDILRFNTTREDARNLFEYLSRTKTEEAYIAPLDLAVKPH